MTDEADVADPEEPPEEQRDPKLWKKNGWIARVVKNENDDGWAVEMTRVGDAEPALVGPWTMGRDKKNPKPLNPSDFATLVKTASEVLERAAAHARAQLQKRLTITGPGGVRWRMVLDIVPDEDEPTATLTAIDEATGDTLWQRAVPPGFALSARSVQALLSEGADAGPSD